MRILVRTLLLLIFLLQESNNGATRRWIPSIAAAGGGTFLLNENFEGTGAPSGWSTVGSFNYDYTTTVLEGAQSARSPAIGTDGTAATLGSDHSEELWGKFRFQVGALPSSGGFFEIISLPNQALSSGFRVVMRDTGALGSGNAAAINTVTTCSANTTYYVWWHYLKGTGANGKWDIWFDTVDTRPSSAGNNHCGTTTDSYTHDVGYFEAAIAKSGTASSEIIDLCQIKNADFQ